jgi:hypothetical protein
MIWAIQRKFVVAPKNGEMRVGAKEFCRLLAVQCGLTCVGYTVHKDRNTRTEELWVFESLELLLGKV